jgi:hypothetical protein
MRQNSYGGLVVACSLRFELGGDHCACNALFDYINDDSFFGGFGRLSRRLGRSRANFLGGRLPCTRFDSQLFGLCLYSDAVRCFLGSRLCPGVLGCLSGSGPDFFVRAFPRFETGPFRVDACCFRLAMTVSH